MYCPNCGAQIEDDSRFCSNCGAQVAAADAPIIDESYAADAPAIDESHAADAPAMDGAKVAEAPATDVSQVAAAPPVNPSSKLPAKKILIGVAAAAIVVVAALLFFGGKGGKASKQAVYGTPELPDVLYWETELDNEEDYIFTSKVTDKKGSVYTIGYEDKEKNYFGSAQTAENGYFAIQEKGNEELRVYTSTGSWKTLEAPVIYYILSGDGSTLVYGTTETNTWKWDLNSGKKEELSTTKRAYQVSYDGSTVFYSSSYQRGKGEEIHMGAFGHPVAVSEDGNTIIYRERYTSTTGDVSTRHYDFGVQWGKNNRKTVFSAPDPDYDITLVANTADCREFLFSYKNEIYYCSVNEVKKSGDYAPKRIPGSGKGELMALRNVKNQTILMGSWYNTLKSWKEDGAVFWTGSGFVQNSIKNNLYLQLADEGDRKTAQLVWINDSLELSVAVPDITGTICLSDDGEKLWTSSNDQLVYVDLSGKIPKTHYCVGAYIQNIVPNEDQMLQTPVCTISNGMIAYFIGTDNALYKCEAKEPDKLTKIIDGVFWITKTAGDNIFILKGTTEEYFKSGGLDCYQLSGNETIFQHGGVTDVISTKNDVFIVLPIKDEDDEEYYFDKAELYKKDGSEYVFIDKDLDPYYLEGYYRGEKIDN